MKKYKLTAIAVTALLSIALLACNNEQSTSTSPQTNVDSISKIERDSMLIIVRMLQDSLDKMKVSVEENKKGPVKAPIEVPTVKPDYMKGIDWMWNEVGEPKKLYCMAYVVTGGGAPKLRTNASARECVMNAINAYRKDNLELAINWLCAGQCHNINAQQDIRNAGQSAAQYAYQTYGAQTPE